MKDLHDVGGVPVLMKALLDGGYLHGDCITVTGKHHRRESARTWCSRRTRTWCGRPRTRCRPTGGVVVLKGNLAPQGAIVKVAGMQGLHAEIPRARALLRPRGGLLRGGRGAAVQGRRRARHPLRRAARRAGHARDAGDDGGAVRGRAAGDNGRAHHRRALLGRHARLLRRPCRARGGGRRADRPAARRRHDRHRRRRRHARASSSATPSWPRAAPRGSRGPTSTSRALCGATRRPWATPRRAPSPIPARRRRHSATPTFETTLSARLRGERVRPRIAVRGERVRWAENAGALVR